MSRIFTRLLAASLLALAAAGSGAQTVEVEGVKLESSAQVGNAALLLNGAGLRTRVFFKVYVAALYVAQKSADANVLLAQKGPRRIAITMLRNVDAEAFADALNEGLRNNHSPAQLASLKAQIDALNATLKLVGEAKKGDLINFEFVPEVGTRVMVNGQPRGAVIAGEEFFTAVLRIWIGDKPVEASLKKGLLGG
jgi:Chalcone isomerase-like